MLPDRTAFLRQTQPNGVNERWSLHKQRLKGAGALLWTSAVWLWGCGLLKLAAAQQAPLLHCLLAAGSLAFFIFKIFSFFHEHHKLPGSCQTLWPRQAGTSQQLVECTCIYCNTFSAQSITLKHRSVITVCTAASERHGHHRHAALQALQQTQRRLQRLTKTA